MNLPFKVCLILLVLLISISGLSVLAQGITPAGPQDRGPMMPQAPGMRGAPEPGRIQAEQLLRLLEQPAAQKALVITEEQRKKIEELSFNVRKTAIQQQAVLQVQRMELERLMQADSPDRAAIEKKIPEISQAEAAVMRARINALLDLRAVLTKEQRDKVRTFADQRARQAARMGGQQAPPRAKVAPPVPLEPMAPPQPPAR